MTEEKMKKGLTEAELKSAVENAEKILITQKLALFDATNNKFLLIFNANNKKWELPGGLVDKDEDLKDALAREVQEEIGSVLFTEPKIACIEQTRYTFSFKTDPVLIVCYSSLYKDGDISLSKEHTDYAWKTFVETQELKESEIDPVIRKVLQGTIDRMKELGYLNDLKHCQADFENYKKRMASDRQELLAHLTKAIVADLIPILDNFHAATEHVPPEAAKSPWVTGITYIEKQFEDVMKTYGVEPLTVKVGDTFDPSQHEAIGNEQSAKNSKQEGARGTEPVEVKGHTIGKVVQKGYTIGGKVVRAAKVIVK